MCGICGIINFNHSIVDEISIRQMMHTMKHRGPDDDGVFIENNVGFGYVRLSIIDLSIAGHQPMFDNSGRYVMIFNGEIYNYIELKEELRDKYNFNTKTDSEVLLAAYIVWGESCLNKFNGMFAFAIYDRQKKAIFAARDRFGIKPFYYYTDNNKFVFASEIPAILMLMGKRPEPDDQSIYDFLIFNRTDQTENTFYKNIKKLQHGHQLNCNNNKISIKKWYNLKEHIGNAFESSEEYKNMLSSAIGLRLRSDVPVGVCLSGGLDSSSIVSILLKDYNKNDLNTFSAVYGKGEKSDESEYIDEYKGFLKNMHYTYPTAETLHNDMFSFMKAHAEPVPSTSPYAQFMVMKLAKDYVTVLLDGQGADEQLGGYHYFFGFYYKELLKKFKWLLLFNEIISYNKNHHSFYALKSFFYFLLPGFIKTKLRNSEKGYLKREFQHAFSGSNNIVENLYGSGNLNESLIDHFEFKLEHLLKWEDRNSMWFSLESRVPFLDYRLVEKTLALPSRDIIREGNTKFILREAMKEILPEKIRTRQSKIGFATPEDEWFRTKLFFEYVNDLINSKLFSENNYIDVNKIKKLYKNHIDKKVNISQEIWKWIHLSEWMKNL